MSELLYKAIITDIDGTLVQYQPHLSDIAEIDALIPSSAVEAISRLHLAGLAVAAVTGRTFEQSRDVLNSLGITGPCIFAGGAAVRDMPTGEILYEASLDTHTLQTVRSLLYKKLGRNYPLDLAPSASDPSKFNSVWAIIDKSRISDVLDELSSLDGVYHVVNEGAGQTNEVGLLVLRGGVDKGSGTRHLLSLLGVEREEAACIGDGANDVLMFEECGLKIAMGNGEDILKQNANYVVGDIDRDGFAEAAEIILQGAHNPTRKT